MYICPICNTPYDAPLTVRERVDLNGEGAYWTSQSRLCPICSYPADPARGRADMCPKCEKSWKPEGEKLCRSCREDLLRRVTDFMDRLTTEEEGQFDDWMDGASITDRGSWNYAEAL